MRSSAKPDWNSGFYYHMVFAEDGVRAFGVGLGVSPISSPLLPFAVGPAMRAASRKGDARLSVPLCGS